MLHYTNPTYVGSYQLVSELISDLDRSIKTLEIMEPDIQIQVLRSKNIELCNIVSLFQTYIPDTPLLFDDFIKFEEHPYRIWYVVINLTRQRFPKEYDPDIDNLGQIVAALEQSVENSVIISSSADIFFPMKIESETKRAPTVVDQLGYRCTNHLSLQMQMKSHTIEASYSSKLSSWPIDVISKNEVKSSTSCLEPLKKIIKKYNPKRYDNSLLIELINCEFKIEEHLRAPQFETKVDPVPSTLNVAAACGSLKLIDIPCVAPIMLLAGPTTKVYAPEKVCNPFVQMLLSTPTKFDMLEISASRKENASQSVLFSNSQWMLSQYLCFEFGSGGYAHKLFSIVSELNEYKVFDMLEQNGEKTFDIKAFIFDPSGLLDMAAILLSSLYAAVISPPQVYKGFCKLVEAANDLSIDIFSFSNTRAVVDEILPPGFLKEEIVKLPANGLFVFDPGGVLFASTSFLKKFVGVLFASTGFLKKFVGVLVALNGDLKIQVVGAFSVAGTFRDLKKKKLFNLLLSRMV